jgi:hypothetical protein
MHIKHVSGKELAGLRKGSWVTSWVQTKTLFNSEAGAQQLMVSDA